MSTPFNLPDGVLVRDCEGPPMLRCENCREEYSGYDDEPDNLCPDCLDENQTYDRP